jgi:hypothetical protein
VADILPGYTYNRQTSRYRDQSSGRFVSRRDVLDLLDRQITGAERRLSDLTTAMHEGRIAPGVWAEQMRTEVRRLHSQNAAVGMGGWDRMDARAWGRIGGNLRSDYQRIVQLAHDIVDGKATLPQALARVHGYVGSARVEFWAAERQNMQPAEGMILIERRRLGVAEHCEDCISFYDSGWQNQEVLPVPGERSRCRSNCRCGLDRREIPQADLADWIGTKRAS